MNRVYEEIYHEVKKIPFGQVTTYGIIAKKVRTNPRVVGLALHKNPNSKSIPCHRVVDRNGRLAKNYAFGGWREQKRKLLGEGIKFKNKRQVDLSCCKWVENKEVDEKSLRSQ